MSITQLSVFVENKPGHLADTLATLAAGNVNIHSFTIADTEDYGILRIVVDDVDRAKQILASGGYTVAEHKVVRALIPNVPGSLAAVARLVSDSGLDIEYLCLGAQDSLVIRTEELERLETLLVDNGFRVVRPGEFAF